MEDFIDSVIEFWRKVRGEDSVNIRFKKQDGSIRIMKCTLNFDKIPDSKKPKSVNIEKILKLLKDNKIIHVFDLEKNDWRSVPFQKVEWLETPTKKFSIRRR